MTGLSICDLCIEAYMLPLTTVDDRLAVSIMTSLLIYSSASASAVPCWGSRASDTDAGAAAAAPVLPSSTTVPVGAGDFLIELDGRDVSLLLLACWCCMLSSCCPSVRRRLPP